MRTIEIDDDLHPEQFKKHIDQLWREAKQILGRKGEFCSRLDVWDTAGRRKVGIMPGDGEPMTLLVAAALKKFGGVAFVHIAESWFSTNLGVRPATDPARAEALILTAVHPEHGESRMLLFRHDERGEVNFGVERTLNSHEFQSDITHLLDEHPWYRDKRRH